MTDDTVDQICPRPIQTPTDLELHCRVTVFSCWLKIFAKRSVKLTPDLVVNCELGIEMKFSVKIHRARGRQANVRRSQNELIDRDQPGGDVIPGLGLLQMQLCQFFDLENLPERN